MRTYLHVHVLVHVLRVHVLEHVYLHVLRVHVHLQRVRVRVHVHVRARALTSCTHTRQAHTHVHDTHTPRHVHAHALVHTIAGACVPRSPLRSPLTMRVAVVLEEGKEVKLTVVFFSLLIPTTCAARYE